MFSKEIAPYVISKPLYPSQKTKWKKDWLEVKIKIIPNYELEQLILSFGEHVKVIYPENLKIRMSKRIKLASNQY